MKKKADRFNYHIQLNMRQEDVLRVRKLQSKSTHHTMSAYLRSTVLQKPVKVHYRNKSADELLLVMNEVKNELTAIHRLFGQILQQLYEGEQKPGSESRISELEERHRLQGEKMEEIRLLMIKNYELCLQTSTGPMA